MTDQHDSGEQSTRRIESETSHADTIDSAEHAESDSIIGSFICNDRGEIVWLSKALAEYLRLSHYGTIESPERSAIEQQLCERFAAGERSFSEVFSSSDEATAGAPPPADSADGTDATAPVSPPPHQKGSAYRRRVHVPGDDPRPILVWEVPVKDGKHAGGYRVQCVEAGGDTRTMGTDAPWVDLGEWEAHLSQFGFWEYQTDRDAFRLSPGGSWDFEVPLHEETTLSDFLECVAENQRAKLRECFNRCHIEEEPFEALVKLDPSVAERTWLTVSGKPATTPTGTIRGVIEDVTEHTRVEQELQTMNQVLRQTFRTNLSLIVTEAADLESTLVDADIGEATSRSAASAVESGDQPLEAPHATPDKTEPAGSKLTNAVSQAANSDPHLMGATARIQEYAKELESVLLKSRQLEESLGGDETAQELNLGALAQTIVSNYRTLYPEATIEKTHEDVIVYGNPVIFETVIATFVEYGITSTDTNGQVTLRVATAEDDTAVIDVEYSGYSISDRERQLLESNDPSLRDESDIDLVVAKWLLSNLGAAVDVTKETRHDAPAEEPSENTAISISIPTDDHLLLP